MLVVDPPSAGEEREVNPYSKTLRMIIRGGRVRRFHTVPTVAEHTVGHHSFGVAWFIHLLYRGRPPVHMLIAALTHDLAECEVGDIPAPAKRALNSEGLEQMEGAVLSAAGIEMPDLSPEERRILKMADCMDGMVSCIHERRLGNLYLDAVYDRFLQYVLELKPQGLEMDLIGELQVEMKKARRNEG